MKTFQPRLWSRLDVCLTDGHRWHPVSTTYEGRWRWEVSVCQFCFRRRRRRYLTKLR